MDARRLLVVDDDPSLAAIVSVLARRAGHAFAWAADAAAADEEAARQRPCLVLLDVNLPGTSGIEWLRSLRQRDRALPVALFAQSALAYDVARGMEAGADFHFAKELVADPARWARRLAEILALADGRTRPASLGSSLPPDALFGRRAATDRPQPPDPVSEGEVPEDPRPLR